MSKPGGISLPVQEVMKAANLCLRKVSFFHQKLAAALQELEERVAVDREIRQSQLRQYRALVQSTSKQSTTTNDEETEEMDVVQDDTAATGIDRNDPILQWNYLHKAVSVREGKK